MNQAEIQLIRLYVSVAHNFFGHHGRAPGVHSMEERDEVRCVAGRGLEGDRFFGFKADYKGQITFFAEEVYLGLCQRFCVWDREPSVFRRNAITRGADLHALIGKEFEIQGIRFLGVEHCTPCHWMNHAFHPGAEAVMQGQGGLRARILSTGILRRNGTRSQ